jgi:hypothetical protein
MKKIIFILSSLLLLASCEEDKVTYNGSEYIQFLTNNVTTLTVDEHAGKIEIKIGLSHKLDENLVIEFTYQDGTAIANQNYIPVQSITVPAGEFYGVLEIPIIDDQQYNENRNFKVKISNVSNSNYKIGLGEIGTFEKTISIIDNDCRSTTAAEYWIGPLQDLGGTTGNYAEYSTCDELIYYGDIIKFYIKGKYIIKFTASETDPNIGTVLISNATIGYNYYAYDMGCKATGTYNKYDGKIRLNATATYFYSGYYYSDYDWTGITNTISKID